MSNIKNSLQNSLVRGDKLEATKNTIKPDQRHFQREARNIQEGIRKDRKIKMNHKTFN